MKNFYCRFSRCFYCEKNLAYFCPVWHILKHNLVYFVFVDLATLKYIPSFIHPSAACNSRLSW